MFALKTRENLTELFTLIGDSSLSERGHRAWVSKQNTYTSQRTLTKIGENKTQNNKPFGGG